MDHIDHKKSKLVVKLWMVITFAFDAQSWSTSAQNAQLDNLHNISIRENLFMV